MDTTTLTIWTLTTILGTLLIGLPVLHRLDTLWNR